MRSRTAVCSRYLNPRNQRASDALAARYIAVDAGDLSARIVAWQVRRRLRARKVRSCAQGCENFVVLPMDGHTNDWVTARICCI
jgi:hypothetical protein